MKGCTATGCDDRGIIRLLNNDHGFRRFCLKHAREINDIDGWRDACGDLFRAREWERSEMMLREMRR
jgi:hypothetical protein